MLQLSNDVTVYIYTHTRIRTLNIIFSYISVIQSFKHQNFVRKSMNYIKVLEKLVYLVNLKELYLTNIIIASVNYYFTVTTHLLDFNE